MRLARYQSTFASASPFSTSFTRVTKAIIIGLSCVSISVLWSPDDIPLNGDAEYQIQGSVSFGIHNSKCFNSSNDVINVFYSSDVDIHKFAIGIDVVMKSSSPSEQDILSLTKAMGDKGWDARLIEDDNIVMGFSNGSSSITASPDREQELFTLEANV